MRVSVHSGLGGDAITGINGPVQIPGSSGVTNPAAASVSWGDTFLTTLEKGLPLYEQVKIINAKLKIAKSRALATGSDINVQDLTAPPYQAQVGLDKNTTLLIGAGIAILAVILLTKKR